MDAVRRPAAPIALAVFDMAGTTIEDTGVVPVAFDAALAAHGLSATPAQLNAVRGAAKREAIRALVQAQRGDSGLDAASEAVYASFVGELDRRFRGGGIRPISGASLVFDWLRARGVKVALNTGFDRVTQQLVLDAAGWRSGVADALICGDDVALGRPAPDMIHLAMQRTGVVDAQRVLNVGDTVLDLQAAANAACGLSVGVCSGAHSREQLERAPHTALLASVADLPAWLQSVPGALA
jgi:phosphonatase-like hydrolase